ncbi:hypothetical protein JCM19046_964 [Bacillus sp. JCM 19046]|uniref:Uncharacterized protein n=1 Tax=Shouchella xiaoxiensis TaxID=766895 RepID=A0ABS2SPR2_9BACI|nr:hypothetical protein [Shouchella xiaoxiensis]MBM7837508.1 hypothetical protein [Shouchella xiaoxiensis]GAF14649.1 hypothetical protein JCM19045_3972 [Bacillus sp. JCM 19045]GAF16520.1 hypothetical protein JCM19046_964 [Bacillus sp. JCM 19046]
MKQVLPSYHSYQPESRLSVLRLEIDYQLMSLHDALLAEDIEAIQFSKKLLNDYRLEWLHLTKQSVY